MSNDNKALVALTDLVLAIVEVLEAPTDTQRAKAMRKLAATKWGWKETLAQARQERATGRPGLGAVVSDGLEAKAAVEATVRRWEAYAESRRELQRHGLTEAEKLWRGSEGLGVRPVRWQLMQELRDMNGEPVDPIEADDSRVTDGHSCCGGKPDCGCRSVGG